MTDFPRDVKDRVVEHPNRYQIIPVEGTADQFDFVPVTGTITEAGTIINKGYLQPIEDKLSEAAMQADFTAFTTGLNSSNDEFQKNIRKRILLGVV